MDAIVTAGNPLRQFFIKRPRIDRLFEQAIKRPIVIVSAGAGYGKSHAVYSFVHKYPVSLFWLGFTVRDNVGEHFWEDFTSAVRMVNLEAAEALAGLDFPSTDRQFERYFQVPVKKTKPDTNYIFVYDDLHLIHNKEVLRFMEKNITSPFSNITSILISRASVPLKLMGFESKGLVAKIGQEDLKFSRAEMLEYLDMRGVHPPKLLAENIYNSTDGWAFAIRLAGEVLTREQKLPVMLGDYSAVAFRSNIFRLIEEEILSAVSPELRRLLIKLSLIDLPAADLVRELAGEEFLDSLGQISSFINLDSYTNIYSIHPLLQKYLRGLAEELSPGERRDVYRKAADWSFARGNKLNAAAYYDKAGDYLGIFKVIYAMPMIMNDETATLLLGSMLRAPPEIYRKNPQAYVIRTLLFIILARFEDAENEIREYIGSLEARDDAMENPAIARALAGLYNTRGLSKFLTCQTTGDYDFLQDLEKAFQYYKVSRFKAVPPYSVYNVSSYICRVGVPGRGEMEKFIAALVPAVAFISVSIGGCTYGMDDLAEAELAFFRGDLLLAEEWSHRAVKKARECFQYEIENRALFFLLRIALNRGDGTSVKNTLKELEDQLGEENYFNRLTNYDIVNGWFYAQLGQLGRIASWLKNNFEESDLNSIVYGQEILVKAKYHLAAGEYPVALASLRGNDHFGINAFLLGRIETKVLEAVCRYKNGNRPE
ncbi:MAG: helix-turn-helix transcriptional regulator, partial [Treponema sp.]|nr:helix-turn-helix transcriptional regulator [Treponema sp.]